MIDPALSQILETMARSGFALPFPRTAVSLRATLDQPMPGAPIAIARVEDIEVPGGAGPIAARFYHPAPGETRSVGVLLHGGGWVFGTLDTHDALARVLARDAGCAILSLDYRRAPEHPHPAALDDALAAIGALPALAGVLGIDAAQYAVIGDSAGGNLAAAVAIALAGRPDAPVAQVLFYPVIDRRFDTPSYLSAPETPFITPDLMRFCWASYCPDGTPATAALLNATIDPGVAPATIVLGGCDPLHDEGAAYADKLRAAGVPVSVHDFPGGAHGFASLFGMVGIADEAIAVATASLRSVFETRIS